MTNTYHSHDPEDYEQKLTASRMVKTPVQEEKEHQDTLREASVTLERAAANCNLSLHPGFKTIKNPSNSDQPFKQPFWFAREMHESVGVYVEAKSERFTLDDNTVRMMFDVKSAREDLANLMINYYTAARSTGLTFVQFAGQRGFEIKTLRP